MKYRLIACDLDETLIRSDRTISERNIEAVQEARRLGVKFVPATGRGYKYLGPVLRLLGLEDREGEYAISYNGAALTENRGNRVLCFEGLPFDTAEKLYRYGLDCEVGIHVYTPDALYVRGIGKDEWEYLAGRTEAFETRERSLEFLKGQKIAKLLYVNTDCGYLRQVEAGMGELAAETEISYSSGRYLECNRKGVNKGRGLLTLSRYLGIDPAETIAIGDNFNDLSMLQAAGLGAGVANTPEEMKPLCGYVAQADYNHGAVAEVIGKFVLGR